MNENIIDTRKLYYYWMELQVNKYKVALLNTSKLPLLLMKLENVQS